MLDGYYASGDHECFCFDRCDGPEAHDETWLAGTEEAPLDEQLAATRREMDSDCRVYPNDLLPDGAHGRGRWTITVEFEATPSKEET